MLSIRRNGELGLVWGIFVIGAIFFAAVFAAMWVLFLIGWNPLERAAYAYADSAISLIVGVISVVGIFRWARKPNGPPFPEIDSVNKFLQEADGGGYGKFIEVSGYSGGTKHMECRIYLAAFNHTDTETILKAVDQAPWRDKEMVQVFVKEQEEELFRLRYNGGSKIG